MESSLISLLPNLSIGVVSVLGLAYVSLKYSETQRKMQEQFLKALEERADKHATAMSERETAMRTLETNIRATMTDQLTKNTIALTDIAKLMARFARHLDGEK